MRTCGTKFMNCLVAVLLVTTALAFAKTKTPPPAPLPAEVTQAKTVFLSNAGGSSLAFDTFYQDVKTWGKYQIVGSPDSADIIIELRYWTEHDGTRAVPLYNSYTKQTTYYDRELVDPQLQVTIYNSHSKVALWSSIDHTHLARLRSNREKELEKSADRLVEEMKSRSQ